MRFIFFLIWGIFLVSCKPAKKEVVLVSVEAYKVPISLVSSLPSDLDEIEFSNNSGGNIFSLTVSNNSVRELRNLKLEIPLGQKLFRFLGSGTGERQAPGFGGTCQDVLELGDTCVFMLEFTPNKRGQFDIPLVVKYLNLVEPAQEEIHFHGFIGTPAELIFEDFASVFPLGSLEQSETMMLEYELTVVNIGELSARNFNIQIQNSSVPSSNAEAFKIVEDHCTPLANPLENSRFKGGGTKCKIKVGYRPYNNTRSDPETLYKGNLIIDHETTPNATLGKLTGTLNFNAFLIEGNFNTDTQAQITFPILPRGNFRSETFSITNKGQWSGIPLAFHLHAPSGGLPDARCTKGQNSNMLSCFSGNTPLGPEFPLKIKDSENCMETEVWGNNKPTPQDKTTCQFEIIFWPDITGPSISISQVDIKLEYDSLWKKQVGTILTTDSIIATIGQLQNQELGKLEITGASLTLYHEKPASTTITPEVENTGSDILPLGMIPFFTSNDELFGSSNQYNHSLNLTYKNEGGTALKVSQIVIEGNDPMTLDVSPGAGNIASSGFYTINNGCVEVGPGETCNVLISIAPRRQSQVTLEEQKMFDVMSSPSNGHKKISFSYHNGANYKSDGSSMPSSKKDIKLKSEIEKKGILWIVSPSMVKKDYLSGETYFEDMKIQNIGAGPLAFNETDNTGRLNPPVAKQNDLKWATQIINSGESDDCGIFGMGASDYKILQAGEVCSLKLRMKLSESYRHNYINGYAYSTESLRGYDTHDNYFASSNTSASLSFLYHNTLNTLDDAQTLLESNKIEITTNFRAPLAIVPYRFVQGSAVSGIFYRHSVTYEGKSDTYPKVVNFVPVWRPITYFDSSGLAMIKRTSPPSNTPKYSWSTNPNNDCPTNRAIGGQWTYPHCWNKISKDRESFEVFDTLLQSNQITLPPDTYGVYIGTFPINYTMTFQLSFRSFNSGSWAAFANSLKLIESLKPPNFPIKKVKRIDSNITKPFNGGEEHFKHEFSFKAASAGIYERCYTIEYQTGRGDVGVLSRETHFCIYGQALNPGLSPGKKELVSIEYADIDKSCVDNSSNCNLPLTYNDITSRINTYRVVDGNHASFQLMAGSGSSLRKRFKITNNTNKTLKDLTVPLLSAPMQSLATRYGDNTRDQLSNLLRDNKVSIIRQAGQVSSNYNLGNYQNGKKMAVSPNDEGAIECGLVPTGAQIKNQTKAGIDLAPGESCVLEIDYAPISQHNQQALYLGAHFEIADNQYVTYNGKMVFQNSGVPNLTIANVTYNIPTNIESSLQYLEEQKNNSGLLGIITKNRASQGVAINSNPNDKKTALVLNGLNDKKIFEIEVTNHTSDRTSLSPQWKKYLKEKNPGETDPAIVDPETIFNNHNDVDAWFDIYEGYKGVVIRANRACMVGSDNGQNAPPYNFRGFHKNSSRKCRLKIELDIERTFSGTACDLQKIGGYIGNKCNPYAYELKYGVRDQAKNIEIETVGNQGLRFHMYGYVRPNDVQGENATSFAGLQVSPDGSVSFDAPKLIPKASSRGGIRSNKGIIICWDKEYLNLHSMDLYDLNLDDSLADWTNFGIEGCKFFDTNETSHSFYLGADNFMTGDYYFVRAYAVRERVKDSTRPYEQDLIYLSHSNIETLFFPIPASDMSYDHLSKSLIDKSVAPGVFVGREEAKSFCEAQDQKIQFNIMNKNKSAQKKLINTDVFRTILQNEEISENYPNNQIGFTTHWLGDDAVDIASSISLYDGTVLNGFPNFDASEFTGISMDYNLFYSKSCQECNSLYKLVGGDGTDLPPDSAYYTDNQSQVGAIRCYAKVPCPVGVPGLQADSISCNLGIP